MSALRLNLRSLLTGDLNKLRYIKRFGTALTLHKENVAEHTFYVMLYAYFISEAVKVEVDQKKLLVKCLFHDVEEVRTGDFPRPFKYRRPELRELLEQAAEEEFSSIIDGVLPKRPDVVMSLTSLWRNAKDTETYEGAIVALADYLSVISHLWQEVNSSNASMHEHYVSVMDYLGTFKHENFDFMRDLIIEVEEITHSIFMRSKEQFI